MPLGGPECTLPKKFLDFNIPEMANYTHLAVETRILMVFSLVFRASTRDPDIACIFFGREGMAHTPTPPFKHAPVN